MKQILENIWTWSVFSEEKGYNFNSLLISDGNKRVLIDPVKTTEEDFSFIKSKAPFEAIYLTNKDHFRDTYNLKTKLSIPTWIHKEDKQYLENDVDYTFSSGDKLACGIEVVHLSDQKSPGECAFYIPSKKVLILGDALIGYPAGSLKLLPDSKYKDINKTKEELFKLQSLSFNILLLGDGEAILEDAQEKVIQFLQNNLPIAFK